MKKWLFIFSLLLPLFAFAKERPIVILDPGHGGKDEGAKIRNCIEKKMTLRTAYLTKKELEVLGYRVILTRARDVFLPLTTRVTLSNRRPNALFVSIHYNSAASPAANGIEIFYYNKGQSNRVQESKKIASSILQHMVKETGAHSRGVKQGNFQVIRETAIPGVLVEAGFITNAEERKSLMTQTYLEKLGRGIARGVDKYVHSRV